MTELVLKRKERLGLEQLVSQTQEARLLQRASAWLWLADDEPVPQIATQRGVTRQTVYNWVDRFGDRQGLALELRLADGERSGRPPTAHGISDPLIERVIETEPRTFGFNSTVWTAPWRVCYLERDHQIDVSCQSVRLAIARFRLRWKRPRHQLALRPATWKQAKGG